jgi:chaperone modulatory protein CbpM
LIVTDYRIEAIVIEDNTVYQLTELTQVIGLEPHHLRELIDCELLAIERLPDGTFRCTSQTFTQARRAARLAHDFELSPEGLALAVRLLKRIEELQGSLARLPRSHA